VDDRTRWTGVLDPVDRFSEMLYGLLIALSVTGSISVGAGGARNVRLLLSAALGANVAWGIVDAVMYVMGTVLRRARARAMERAVRMAADAQDGRRLIAGAVPADVAGALTPPELEAIRRKIVARNPPESPRLGARDLLGAVAVFFMVVLATFPATLPFLVVKDVDRAVRISHAVVIALLFLGGCGLGRYAGLRTIRMGLATTSMGVVLFVLTIALGG
jgi:VIT1/CCC1 family predicted Fe2+/Mn2+ transporter